MKPAVFIIGPTASGKTALSIAMAHKLNAEIINADSMIVYEQLNIGSAKPTMAEREGVIHHMIGVVDVEQPYSVAEYVVSAEEAISSVYDRGKLPIICGGTGLYINSLLYDLNFTSVSGDEAIRAELTEYVDKNGPEALYNRLREVDPISAQRLHVNDVKRVIRALEVYLSSGKPLSAQNNEFVDQSSKKFKRDAIVIGLKWERCVLRERIKKRVDIMLSQGLVEEARALYDAAQDHSHPSYKGLGYSQLFKFFSGEYLFDEAVERIKIETAQYAKRQMTWFNRIHPVYWIDCEPGKDPLPEAMRFYQSNAKELFDRA